MDARPEPDASGTPTGLAKSNLTLRQQNAALREAIKKARIQISGGLTYTTAEAKHAQLKDADDTLSAALESNGD